MTCSSQKCETLGERIARLRSDRRWSQKTFATRVHIDEAEIRKFEENKASPQVDAIVRMADGLGVSIDYLLTGENFLGKIANLAQDWRAERQLRIRLGELQALPEPNRGTVLTIMALLINLASERS